MTRGGGELGRGFYTGEHLHEAKAWAFNTSGDKQRNVVAFDTKDDSVEALQIILLEHGTAALRRHAIRKGGHTRTYLFTCDLVWAPIVGSERASGDQFKWESANAQDLLNSEETTRIVV